MILNAVSEMRKLDHRSSTLRVAVDIKSLQETVNDERKTFLG